MYILNDLLIRTLELKASDLHLTVGIQPTVRVNGKLIPIGPNKLMPEDIREFAKEILGERFERYNQIGEADTSYSVQLKSSPIHPISTANISVISCGI